MPFVKRLPQTSRKQFGTAQYDTARLTCSQWHIHANAAAYHAWDGQLAAARLNLQWLRYVQEMLVHNTGRLLHNPEAVTSVQIVL